MKEKQKELQKRPNALIYRIVALYFIPHIRRIYKLRTNGVKPVGPAVLISNHTSNEDYKLVAVAAYPSKITFVGTYHWFTFKKFAPWLKLMGVIPKYQFTTDLASLKKIRYVIQKQNGIVYIAPEGTVYANGKLGYISPSIAKLIRVLGAPVYADRIQGAGLGMAKWSAHKHKINHVSVDTQLIISQDEVKNLSVEEIMERINSSISYNEFEYQAKENVTCDATDLAEGMQTMYYRCPHCNSQFRMKTYGNTIECEDCHTKATLGKDFRFTWNTEKQYFDNYIQWYDWQYDIIKKEVSDSDFVMEDEVDYGIDVPGVDNYVTVGHGKLRFDHSGWTYTGTKEGVEVTEHDEVRDVFLATLKVGMHFELPFKYDHCRVFYPKDGNTSMKWHLASRAMSELSNS